MPSSKYACTMSWDSVEVQRSAACLPRLIFSSTGGGATTQPRRIPGERIFENEQLAPVRDLHQPPAALERHGHPRGVLEARHGVDELRPPPLAVQAVER